MTPARELRTDDALAVLNLVGELHEATDPDQLSAVLLSGLATVVQTDLISYNDIDLTGTGSTTTYFEPELVPHDGLETMFDALQHEHPLIRDYAATADPATRRMSDFVSLRRLQSLDLWQEVFKPLETNYQLGLVVALSGERLAGIGLNRWQCDFTDRDMQITDLLRQHLPAAYDHARLRSVLDRTADDLLGSLTRREQEVLALVAEGRTNQQIAARLRIHLRTVDKHAENLRAKLNVRSRTEAAALYLRSSATLGSLPSLPHPRTTAEG